MFLFQAVTEARFSLQCGTPAHGFSEKRVYVWKEKKINFSCSMFHTDLWDSGGWRIHSVLDLVAFPSLLTAAYCIYRLGRLYSLSSQCTKEWTPPPYTSHSYAMKQMDFLLPEKQDCPMVKVLCT